MWKIAKRKGGKRVFSLVFLDPSSLRLASGSPRPPNNFMVKKPTCLGKLQLPQSDPLPINRRPRGVLNGSKVQKLRELREERKKKKEEETKLRRYQIATGIISYIVPCPVFFVQLLVSLFLRFECDLCTLRGPPCYYVLIHLLHLSSVISFFFVKFNFNRSLVLYSCLKRASKVNKKTKIKPTHN